MLFSMLVEKLYLAGFEGAEFGVLINPFTANPGNWQIYMLVHFGQKQFVVRRQWANNMSNVL